MIYLIWDSCSKIKRTHSTQYQKTINSIKNGTGSEQTFFQGRYRNGQQTHEKMLSVTNHQGNANQNHKEISCHSCQSGYYQKLKKNYKCW